MFSKLKKSLPVIIFAVVSVLVGSVLFEKCSSNVEHKVFLSQIDSLHKVNDSLFVEIKKDDAAIDSLNYVSEVLSDKLAHQKTKVIKIIEVVDASKAAIDTYTEHELISSFNTRYPKDTVTNPLPVAQPVLVSAAKDLVELDGAKQIIVLKDSSINTLESQVSLKDTIISKYVKKETTYKNIMMNQETQIKDWKFQYNTLQMQNAKLKAKNKFTKIGAGLITGGLIYLMLAK